MPLLLLRHAIIDGYYCCHAAMPLLPLMAFAAAILMILFHFAIISLFARLHYAFDALSFFIFSLPPLCCRCRHFRFHASCRHTLIFSSLFDSFCFITADIFDIFTLFATLPLRHLLRCRLR
jgi:hypothetical protein